MIRGSQPNLGMPGVSNIPPETGDLAILITHFVSPQQFSYVSLKDVKASASKMLYMENELGVHCTKENEKRTYLVNQKVIVQYKPRSPPKLLRGVVKYIKDDEYIVWTMDYGFYLCCSSLDMWPLPYALTFTFWKIKDGGIAYVSPMNNKWDNSCLRIFDKLIEDAVHLSFDVVDKDKANRNFGKLMFQASGKSEIFQDSAEFLISRKYALSDTLPNIALPTSEAFRLELAELNDPSIEARPRIKNIIQLVTSSNKQFSHCPNYIQRAVDISPFGGQKTMFRDSSLDAGELDNYYFNFCQLDRLRTAIQVPESCRLLRSKVSASKETCVQSALEGRSLPHNQNNEMIRNESSSLKTDEDTVYEDAQSQLGDDFWKNMQLPQRSSSPASSEDSFRTITNEDQTISSPDSSEESLSKSLKESPLKRINSTSASQKAQEKSEIVVATSASSSCAPSDDGQEKSKTLPLASFNGGSLSIDDKLDRKYSLNTNVRQTKSNFSFIQKNVNNLGKSTESKSIDHGSRAMTVLAHSVQTVDPVSRLAELPFCQEIQGSLSEMNIRTVLPMHMYSWPHLLNGGSLVLVNDCDTGRAWSYLPALCSSVLCSLQNSALSRELKLGPLAILLVDSISRANALTSNCASLMSDTGPQMMLKVVNTHSHSLTTCQMILLNSCGILITTSDHLLDLMDHEIALIDPKRLEYFIFDDFDRLRQKTPQALNKVLQTLKGLPTSPRMQLILVAQQWHAKEFKKLLNYMQKPMALFGNFLEAALYGGLRLKFHLKEYSMKAGQLLEFLADHKDLMKRTLIYCVDEMELNDLRRTLTTAGYECVGPSKVQNQQPHQLWVVSDELERPPMAVRNIEVLIHFGLPHTWSKFAERFRVMADQIPNYFTSSSQQDKKKQPLLSYLLLDKSNSQEFSRLTELLGAHGFKTDGAPWMNCQPHADASIPYCPYKLRSGECTVVACNKRHYHIKTDMPPPGNPLLQEGTIIRCKLYRAYDPGHMAVWPMEYQAKGSAVWVAAPYPVKKWTAALELSMGTKQNIHSPCRLGDVCVIQHLGFFKRVKIVDIQPKRPVTVQVMDYGTELLHVYASHLLQCPEERFWNLPALAMDIQLAGMVAGESKWLTDTTKWVQHSFSNISDRQKMQITVDFAMINLVFVKEVTLVEECPTMRTSVYKLILRNELINRGFARMDSQCVSQLREMREQQKKVNEEVVGNKENIQLATTNACHPDYTKTIPAKKREAMMEILNRIQTKEELAEADSKNGKLNSTKTIDTSNENIGPSSPAAGLDQSLTSTEAFCNALMQELSNISPSKKQDSHKFIQSILEGIETPNQKKPTEQRELKLEDDPQEACRGPSAKPVSQSLQYSTIAKGAVRPRVKWHQTISHIELTIEQQVPEYELCLDGKNLFYNVSTSSPPQHLVLSLLGEVKIVSQAQRGYYLKIKLAKIGTLVEWPSLVDNLGYAENLTHWLTYDVSSIDDTPPPAGLDMWDRYSRLQANKNDDTSEDEELFSNVYEPGVERSGSVEICDDC